jgi:drug/metabolite transporter (DMT)-like permease
MNENTKNQLTLHAVVLLLGLTAILGKLTSIAALPVVVYRTFLASILFSILFWARKNKTFDTSSLKPLLLTGMALGLHWVCFFGSARMSTVSLSLVTFSTTSFFTSILEPLSKKESIRKKEMFLGFLVVLGMFFIFQFESVHFNAIMVGLLGAILSSVYSVSNVHLTKKNSALFINLVELSSAFVFAFLATIAWIWIADIPFISITPKGSDYTYLLVLVILCTVLPYLLLINLLKSMSAFTMNMAINMEPIYGIVLAWLIFGNAEKMSGGFYIGAGLIIFSLILNGFWARKKPSQL